MRFGLVYDPIARRVGPIQLLGVLQPATVILGVSCAY
jgi:hypothetical protein